MRIKSIKPHVLTAELSRPFRFSQWTYSRRQSCVLEIETDTGIVGWGECMGPARILKSTIEELSSFIIGWDPLDRQKIWNWLYNRFRDYGQKGIILEGISGIDIALWDIAGKHFNAPVHVLMGGAVRKEITAYATGVYRIDSEKEIELLKEEAASYVGRGFKSIKIKVGFGLPFDVNLVKEIRSQIGPKIGLMIDANHAYNKTDALRLARQLEQYDIFWFEEPVVPEDRNGYKYLRDNTSIPIAGGECEFTRFGFRDLLLSEAVDIIQPDICSAGGISEAMNISSLASAFSTKYNPHVWGTSIALFANLHLLSWLPDEPGADAPAQPLLEYDCTEHPFRYEIVEEQIAVKPDGTITVPERPGLGFTIDRKAIERYSL